MTDEEVDRLLLAAEPLLPRPLFGGIADEVGRLRAIEWRATTVPTDVAAWILTGNMPAGPHRDEPGGLPDLVDPRDRPLSTESGHQGSGGAA